MASQLKIRSATSNIRGALISANFILITIGQFFLHVVNLGFLKVNYLSFIIIIIIIFVCCYPIISLSLSLSLSLNVYTPC